VLWYNFHIDWKRACEDLNEIEKLLFSLMKNIWSLLVLECLVKLLQRHWQIGNKMFEVCILIKFTASYASELYLNL